MNKLPPAPAPHPLTELVVLPACLQTIQTDLNTTQEPVAASVSIYMFMVRDVWVGACVAASVSIYIIVVRNVCVGACVAASVSIYKIVVRNMCVGACVAADQ